MWFTLCALVALALFGSKAASLLIQSALAAIEKFGILSSIAVDDQTRLTLSIRGIQIYLWRNVWRFLKAPTQAPLFTVDCSSLHALILTSTTATDSVQCATEPSTPTEIDSKANIIHLDHPSWQPIRPWLLRLAFVWYLLPLVGVSFSGVSVDVVQDEVAITRIQRANLSLRVRYDATARTATFALTLSKDEAVVIETPHVGIRGEVKNLQVDLTVPVATTMSDLRAPLPSAVHMQCDRLGGAVDVQQLLRHLASAPSRTNRSTQIKPQGSPQRQRTLPFVILQAVPDVSVVISDVGVEFVNGIDDRADVNVRGLGLRVWNPSSSIVPGTPTQNGGGNDGRSEERKVTFDVNSLGLSVMAASSSDRHSLLQVDGLKVEVDTRSTLHHAEEHVPVATWCNRINGESRYIRAVVCGDLAPWVWAVHRATKSSMSPDPAVNCSVEEDENDSGQDDNEANVDVQVQFKVQRTEILCLARDQTCSILPTRVPDLGLSVEEIVVFAHPFMTEEPLGIRAKADIQGSRVKLFYTPAQAVTRTSFLSLDFVRALIEPVYLLSSPTVPAGVELEAEWLEARWTPEAMHSIGGLLDVGIFVMAPMLEETYDWMDDQHWDREAPASVPSMKTREDVIEDCIADSETIKFRFKLKHGIVMVPHSHRGLNYMECVSVDTLNMSIEETTDRFRLSIVDIHISGTRGEKDLRSTQSLQQNRVMRRRPSTLQELASRRVVNSKATSAAVERVSKGATTVPYFSVKVFALEEVRFSRCPMKVLDMFIDDVVLRWDMASQERVVELIRRITFSTWEMLYRMRSTYGIHCTPPTSRYNREGGISVAAGDQAECIHREQLLGKLISAGGDGLNRIHATNLQVLAKFQSGATKDAYEMKLQVGLMASNDLPELWEFGDVGLSVNQTLQVLQVDRVQVRHTVDKRRDYVFGFFEESLRLRQLACRRLQPDSPRRDGMIIDIDGLQVTLSLQLDLVDFADAVQADVAPNISNHLQSFATSWRPQGDVFFRFFHRMPLTPGQPNMWLQLRSTSFKCVDNPMEAWLGHVYPVWIEELAEQELRDQLLEDQITTLKLTNAELLQSEDAVEDMKSLLLEKHSKIYVHKIKKLESNLHYHQGRAAPSLLSGYILVIHIGDVDADVRFESEERIITQRVRELDEAIPSIDEAFDHMGQTAADYAPAFQLAVCTRLQVSVRDVAIRMRDFPTPVALIEDLSLAGDMIIAAPASPPHIVPEFELTSSIRVYSDLGVEIMRPTAFFGPGYIYTMQELMLVAERVLPSLLLDVDVKYQTTPWDTARRIMHGRITAKVEDVAVRLVAAPTAFECGDYLEIAVQRVHAHCSRVGDAAAVVEIDRLSVKIEPDAITNIMELTSLRVEAHVNWGDRSLSSVHFLYPVIFHSIRDASSAICIDLAAAKPYKPEFPHSVIDVHGCLNRYAAKSFALSISGKVAPKTPAESITRRDIAARSAIVLYTKNVEWLIRFSRLYQVLPRYAFPSRGRRRQSAVENADPVAKPSPDDESVLNKFLAILENVLVESFAVVGLDIALYHSEKSPVGIRACINEHFEFAGSLQSAQSDPTPATRCQIPVKVGDFAFAIRDISAAVCDIQVRICTPSTGSRGQSLVSVRDVTLDACGDRNQHSRSQLDVDFETIHSVFNAAASEQPPQATEVAQRPGSRTASLSSSTHSEDQARARSKKNILDHFDIAQHNPYHFRDDEVDAKPGVAMSPSSTGPAEDENPTGLKNREAIRQGFIDDFGRQGFMLGLAASEVRILVTLETVETMIDIVENWVQVIRACLPELNRIPDELVQDNAGSESLPPPVRDLESPKKVTSLADDPKFGPIFHAANEVPTNRLQSFNFDRDGGDEHDHQPMTAASSVVEPFMAARFMDVQISFQNHQHKGSVLLALSCGSLRRSRSQDLKHELIDLKVDGVQVLTAPLDIDVKSRIIWLRTLADGISYCPSSYGLLKQVVTPIPAHVMIWVDNDLTTTHRIDLQIPTIKIGVNTDSKIILQNLILAWMEVVTAKLAQYQSPDYSKLLQGFRNPSSVRSSIQQLIAAKQQLKWEIAEIHWRHTCRWNYQATERANLVMHAVDGVRGHGLRDLDVLATATPMVFMRRLSSASMLSSMQTSLSLTGSATTHMETVTDDLQRLQQQHASMANVLRSLIAAEMIKRQTTPNVHFVFGLQNASLTLSAVNSDIISAAMTNLKVKLKMYEDQSGTLALTIADVACKNLCPNTPYPELLLPLKHSPSWSGGETFVRVDAEVAPSVGGIKVVRHFELNVHPMQVCLTYDLILQLVAFITAASGTTERQEEKKNEIRSQFLSAPQTSGGGSGEGLLKKAVKVAGKAAHPLTHGRARHRSESDTDHAADARTKAMQTLQDEASQWLSRIAQVATEPHDGSAEGVANDFDKDVSEMRDRAKTNLMFKRIRLGTVEVNLSFKNKKASASGSATQPPLPLEDMRGFEVKIHSLVYCDKTCSLLDLLLRMRRDILLDVLSQVGRNFTNVANFLRDQFDISRWAAIDALAPLKSLSSAISGGSTHGSAPAVTSSPSSPARTTLSPELLLQRPRISSDAPAVSKPPPSVDTAKLFQLELPEKHPSRKKKHPAHARTPEPTERRIDPSPSNVATNDAVASPPVSSPRPKKPILLSGLFSSKSKKAINND